MKRIIAAFGLSTGVTFGLFFVMQMLVAGDDEVNLKESDEFRFIDVTQAIEDQEVRREEIEVEKPPEVEAAPEVELELAAVDGPSGLDLSMSGANTGSTFDADGLNIGLSSDGEFLPLVRVPPRYPPRAAERCIGGWVLVEFSVGPEGTILDAFKVDSDPERVFDRAAINAVKKYKYKPRVVDGEPVTVDGVQLIIRFQKPAECR